MKNLILFTFISLGFFSAHAAVENSLDSLQNQITVTTSDSAKAAIYNKIALGYMNYAAIQDRQLKTEYQEKALKYTFSALHSYSRLDDSTSLRICFDRLAKIYRDQHKYSPAKWYILQANTMARAQNDLPNITGSLITLAGIKMDNKNFDWAERDLGEALQLSSINAFSEQQADVMLSYARLWKNLGRPILAANAIQRYDYMKDSMQKDSEAKSQVKVIVKKKLPRSTTRLVKNTTLRSTLLYSSL